MKNINMFEAATRRKFRFPYKGMVAVEDLWDLSVQELDKIFKTLNSEIKEVKEESLLDLKTIQDEELELKIEIIKHIVNVKLEEQERRAKARAIREEKQKIMEILSQKQNAELENKSVEELEKMLRELEG